VATAAVTSSGVAGFTASFSAPVAGSTDTIRDESAEFGEPCVIAAVVEGSSEMMVMTCSFLLREHGARPTATRRSHFSGVSREKRYVTWRLLV
jgi:hypothetical protein